MLLLLLAATCREPLERRDHLLADDDQQHHEPGEGVAVPAVQHCVALCQSTLLEAQDVVDGVEVKSAVLDLEVLEDAERRVHAWARLRRERTCCR